MTEQIETDNIKHFEPSVDEIISEPHKRKLFMNKHSMCDWLSMINASAESFRTGHTQDGQFVYELAYISGGD